MTIAWKIEVTDTMPSTQDAVLARAEENAPEGLVVQTLEQSQGRGRQGNQWTSPLGNLYMSLLLKPLCKPDLAGQISFVIGLALSAAMNPYVQAPHKKTLKWPNDILIDGKKCAGILLESRLSGRGLVESLAVGIGVNILAPPPERAGLQQIAGEKRIAIHRFRDEVLAYISDYYDGWKSAGFIPVRRDWLNQAHGLNHKITARLPGGETKGIFRDIDETGALIIENASGENLSIRAGEVYF